MDLQISLPQNLRVFWAEINYYKFFGWLSIDEVYQHKFIFVLGSTRSCESAGARRTRRSCAASNRRASISQTNQQTTQGSSRQYYELPKINPLSCAYDIIIFLSKIYFYNSEWILFCVCFRKDNLYVYFLRKMAPEVTTCCYTGRKCTFDVIEGTAFCQVHILKSRFASKLGFRRCAYRAGDRRCHRPVKVDPSDLPESLRHSDKVKNMFILWKRFG